MDHCDNGRPRTRGDCKDGVRPCPYLSCRHHMISAFTHYQLYHKTDTEIYEMAMDLPWTCVLDFVEANPDGGRLQQIGDALLITRERARQLLDGNSGHTGRNLRGAIARSIKKSERRKGMLEEFWEFDPKLWDGRKSNAKVSEVHG